jgi:hypothetical protein
MAADFLKAGLGRATGVVTSDRAKKLGGAALTAGGAILGDHLKERLKERQRAKQRASSDGEARAMAIAMARSLRGGKYSDRTPIAGEYRYAVFVGGEPRDVFPPLTKEQEHEMPLAERLRDFDLDRLRDPPPDTDGR